MRNAVRIAAIAMTSAMIVWGSDATAANAPSTTAGATFASKCASCHGKDGSGSTTIGKKMSLRDLRSPAVQKQTDQQLFTITAKGKKKMPAYEKKLSAQQIKDLVTHMRTFKKK